MFDTQQKSTGTDYTTTVAFLVAGLVFSPAMVVFLRPVGYMSVSLAVAGSVLCLAMAWLKWKRTSQLTIPSIAIQPPATK